jgi:hypothetical protein
VPWGEFVHLELDKLVQPARLDGPCWDVCSSAFDYVEELEWFNRLTYVSFVANLSPTSRTQLFTGRGEFGGRSGADAF